MVTAAQNELLRSVKKYNMYTYIHARDTHTHTYKYFRRGVPRRSDKNKLIRNTTICSRAPRAVRIILQ